MTEIAPFPFPSPVRGGAEAYRRLAAVLIDAAASGADLGPRSHQIDLLREAVGMGLRDLVETVVLVLDTLPTGSRPGLSRCAPLSNLPYRRPRAGQPIARSASRLVAGPRREVG